MGLERLVSLSALEQRWNKVQRCTICTLEGDDRSISVDDRNDERLSGGQDARWPDKDVDGGCCRSVEGRGVRCMHISE